MPVALAIVSREVQGALRRLSVREGGNALTIDTGASLDIDFSNFHLLIRNGAKVVIKDGGKID